MGPEWPTSEEEGDDGHLLLNYAIMSKLLPELCGLSLWPIALS